MRLTFTITTIGLQLGALYATWGGTNYATGFFLLNLALLSLWFRSNLTDRTEYAQ